MSIYEYMDSGIEWIGVIPKSWKLKKIGNIYIERNEKVSDKDYAPLSVTKKGIVSQLDSAAKSNDGDNRKLVKLNDFVINSRSDRRGSCGISSLNGSVSLINTVLKPREDINNLFYNYVFKSEGFADEFYRWGNGIVNDLWSTKYSNMKKIYIPYPDIKIQERIANYLNSRCTLIDQTIEKQKLIIEKLKAYKQSVITEAVTKGLNPNVPMKDSGIEVIGEIPSGFKVTKIKKICTIYGRIGFRGYTQEDLVSEGEGAITLSPSNIDNMKITYNKCAYLTWGKYFESPEIQINEGDILFVKTGSSYGKAAIVINLPMEATINPQLIVFKDFIINQKYFMYYLNSSICHYQVEQSIVGGTIPTLSQSKISNFTVIVPKEKELNNIVEYLDRKCSGIEQNINTNNSIIEKLEKYKKSLIYECVTGKREVK